MAKAWRPMRISSGMLAAAQAASATKAAPASPAAEQNSTQRPEEDGASSELGKSAKMRHSSRPKLQVAAADQNRRALSPASPPAARCC